MRSYLLVPLGILSLVTGMLNMFHWPLLCRALDDVILIIWGRKETVHAGINMVVRYLSALHNMTIAESLHPPDVEVNQN